MMRGQSDRLTCRDGDTSGGSYTRHLARVPSGRQERIRERRAIVLELRQHGYSLRAIGQQLGICHEQVRKDLAVVLASTK